MNEVRDSRWPGRPRGSTRVGFYETQRSPEAVILSAAKDLRCARREILRCAQDDTSHLAGSFPKKPPRERTARVARPYMLYEALFAGDIGELVA
jgi:hypothetical protein